MYIKKKIKNYLHYKFLIFLLDFFIKYIFHNITILNSSKNKRIINNIE